MDWLGDPQGWIAFLTLLGLEVVLGIDNVIFISILAGKLQHGQQQKARMVGLGLAMFLRIALLFSLSWVIRLTNPLFSVLDHSVSGRDLILLGGGLFLLAKSTYEIHQKLEGEEGHREAGVSASFVSVIVQILLLDIVFSLDSVITAVGMVEDLSIMVSAVVVAVVIMMVFARPVSRFVDRHPTFKMLALSFLLLIGVTLIAEGWHLHIPKGYVYFAMAFSFFVEILNIRIRKPKTPPVKLHTPYANDGKIGFSVAIITALLIFLTAFPSSVQGGEVFSVRQYETFHDVLHPLEHEALPKRDFQRIRSQATALVRLGREIVKLGVPRGTAAEHLEEYKKQLKKFSAALDGFRAVAKAGSDEQLVRSYNAVHDSFEMLAGMLPRRRSQWPSFRGEQATGFAEGQGLPMQWDGVKGVNIKWKTKIPGLAHSSPVVWDNRVFVTTAISSRGGDNFRHGLYGDGTASEDRSVHQWKLYALDKDSGKILWERTAYEGVPREKRHIKASYANSTPSTDGRYVIAFFGSQGLYAFDMNGRAIWKKDLGILNAGAYDAPDYEWGTASSPIIYKDLVIVQCDTQSGSFLLGANVKNGKTVWKITRDELPSWGTPTIYTGKNRVELVTNASNFIRGYDPNTGKELWRLGGSSKITAPTPVFSGDLIVVASGRRPEAPIFVIRAGALGDITLDKGQSSNKYVAWSKQARGSYMPTPLIYGSYLYVLSNQGVLDCYDLQTGAEIYRQRISHRGGGFSASPVAADGKIYLPSEDGEIFVVKAGPKFEGLATNSIGELIMATPAISDGKMFVRSQHHVFAISR